MQTKRKRNKIHVTVSWVTDETHSPSRQTKGSDVIMTAQEGSLEVDGAAVQPPPPPPPPLWVTDHRAVRKLLIALLKAADDTAELTAPRPTPSSLVQRSGTSAPASPSTYSCVLRFTATVLPHWQQWSCQNEGDPAARPGLLQAASLGPSTAHPQKRLV